MYAWLNCCGSLTFLCFCSEKGSLCHPIYCWPHPQHWQGGLFTWSICMELDLIIPQNWWIHKSDWSESVFFNNFDRSALVHSKSQVKINVLVQMTISIVINYSPGLVGCKFSFTTNTDTKTLSISQLKHFAAISVQRNVFNFIEEISILTFLTQESLQGQVDQCFLVSQ